MHFGHFGKISFSLLGFFCKNVAFKSVLSSDLTSSAYFESLSSARICFMFMFRHTSYYFFDLGFGESIRVIRLPSNFGSWSTFA